MVVTGIVGGVVVVVVVVVVLLFWRAARAWPEDPEQDLRTQPDHYMD